MYRSLCAVLAFATTSIAWGASVNSYTQTNLVSDLPGIAATQDPNLVNPWGLVASSTSPFWVADNGTGLSTLYNGAGQIVPLVVTIPPVTGSAPPSDPTGIVFNGSSGFGGAHFIFSSESGTIVGWSTGTTAAIATSGASGSVYKGLGINGAGGLLYAANFGLGRIDVYNSSFAPVSLPGAFTDPHLPTGYAPFNIENVNGQLYVTYAKSNGGRDEVDGPGLGLVDVYNLNGVFQKRLASNGALNAPWGLAIAPSNFGVFSNDLLVGNFGDGRINAYNPTTGAFAGSLDGTNGQPLSIDGLWGISFGNGSQGQGTDTLFFNAGIAGPGVVEDHGLFGAIATSSQATPEPAAMALTCLGLLSLVVSGARRVGKNSAHR